MCFITGLFIGEKRDAEIQLENHKFLLTLFIFISIFFSNLYHFPFNVWKSYRELTRKLLLMFYKPITNKHPPSCYCSLLRRCRQACGWLVKHLLTWRKWHSDSMSFILRATKCLLVTHMLAYTFSMYKLAALAGMVDVHMSSISYRLVKHQTFLRWALCNFCVHWMQSGRGYLYTCDYTK